LLYFFGARKPQTPLILSQAPTIAFEYLSLPTKAAGRCYRIDDGGLKELFKAPPPHPPPIPPYTHPSSPLLQLPLPPPTPPVCSLLNTSPCTLPMFLLPNPHVPQISRRLARRINKDLAAGRLGNVQIAVAAYVCLLENLKDADSGLFANELVVRQVAKPVHFYHRLLPSTTACTRADETLSVRLPSNSVHTRQNGGRPAPFWGGGAEPSSLKIGELVWAGLLQSATACCSPAAPALAAAGIHFLFLFVKDMLSGWMA